MLISSAAPSSSGSSPLSPDVRIDANGNDWRQLVERAKRGEFAAVLFDCDGTLVDSEPLCDKAWGAVAAELGIQGSPASSSIGTSFEQRIEVLRPQHPDLPSTDALYDRYWARLESLYRAELEPIAPVYEAAVELRAAGVPIAVVSNSDQSRLECTIRCAAPLLSDGLLVGWTEGRRPKPAPDLYLLAASLLGVTATQCLVVEDSAIGATAARRAGMSVVLVPEASAHPSR